MDSSITSAINSLSGKNAALDAIVVTITTYGVPLMIVLVVAQWWLGQPRPQTRHACVAAGASFLLGLALAQIILLFVHRARPYDAGVSHLLIAPTADWSFPSDHAIASTSIIFAGALHGIRRWLGLLITLAFLVCFSRIYVGMHYVTDILGGTGVALLAALSVKTMYRPGTKLDRWLTAWF
jgi:undecaprenyl-diphosphatase